jgi:transposase
MVRNVRAQKQLSPKEKLEVIERSDSQQSAFTAVIKKLANLSDYRYAAEKAEGALSFVIRTTEYFIPLSASINKEEEKERLQKELDYQLGFLKSVQVKLSNERFVANAKPEIIASERKKESDAVAKIKALEEQAANWAGKLDGQDAGQSAKGRKLSDSGAKARLYHAVKEARLANILKVDLKSDLFSYTVDEAALAQAQLMDGKLMLVTNVADLTAAEIVQRYKALADIERGFRVLKSEIEIAPVYHRLPDRIRAHAQICFMALIVYRVMRQRLKQAKSDLSPERALAHLRKIQRHKVRINQAEPLEGVSTISEAQAQVLNALKVNKSIKNEQMSLL